MPSFRVFAEKIKIREANGRAGLPRRHYLKQCRNDKEGSVKVAIEANPEEKQVDPFSETSTVSSSACSSHETESGLNTDQNEFATMRKTSTKKGEVFSNEKDSYDSAFLEWAAHDDLDDLKDPATEYPTWTKCAFKPWNENEEITESQDVASIIIQVQETESYSIVNDVLDTSGALPSKNDIEHDESHEADETSVASTAASEETDGTDLDSLENFLKTVFRCSPPSTLGIADEEELGYETNGDGDKVSIHEGKDDVDEDMDRTKEDEDRESIINDDEGYDEDYEDYDDEDEDQDIENSGAVDTSTNLTHGSIDGIFSAFSSPSRHHHHHRPYGHNQRSWHPRSVLEDENGVQIIDSVIEMSPVKEKLELEARKTILPVEIKSSASAERRSPESSSPASDHHVHNDRTEQVEEISETFLSHHLENNGPDNSSTMEILVQNTKTISKEIRCAKEEQNKNIFIPWSGRKSPIIIRDQATMLPDNLTPMARLRYCKDFGARDRIIGTSERCYV